MVERRVQTTFATDTSGASGPIQALSVQMSGLGSVATGATAMVAALGGALATGALVKGLKGIAGLHAEFESMRISLAGLISSTGLAPDFASGMTAAAQAQKDITIAAAKLPGEAEDYIAVFRSGLPYVSAAIGGGVKEASAFTNKLTAITSAMQISSDQVARDIPRLLAAEKGMAGAHNVTWQRGILPILKSMPEYADITTEKFNRMSQKQRGAILQAFEANKGLTAMIDAAGDTWEAQTGALASNARMLIREASGPLFDGMKSGLKFVNDLLFNSNGEMTDFSRTVTIVGKIVSENVVSGFKLAFEWAEKIGDTLGALGADLMRSPAFARLEGVVSKVGGMLGGLGTPQAPALGGTGPVGSSVSSIMGIGDKLSRMLGPMMDEGLAVAGLFGDMATGVLPGVLSALDSLVGPVVGLLGGFYGLVAEVVERLRPSLSGLFASVGTLAQAIGQYLHPIIRLLGAGTVWLYERIVDNLVPAIDLIIRGFTDVFNFLAKWLGNKAATSGSLGSLSAFANKYLGPEGGGGPQASFFDSLLKSIDDQKKRDEAQRKAEESKNRNPPPNRPAGPVQDFRGSRFDITQKFAAGFDPDRIAVAFAHDVGRVGEQRLQSGHEPAFGVR